MDGDGTVKGTFFGHGHRVMNDGGTACIYFHFFFFFFFQFTSLLFLAMQTSWEEGILDALMTGWICRRFGGQRLCCKRGLWCPNRKAVGVEVHR